MALQFQTNTPEGIRSECVEYLRLCAAQQEIVGERIERTKKRQAERAAEARILRQVADQLGAVEFSE